MLAIIIPSDLCPRFHFSRFPFPFPRAFTPLSTFKIDMTPRGKKFLSILFLCLLTKNVFLKTLFIILHNRYLNFTLHKFFFFFSLQWIFRSEVFHKLFSPEKQLNKTFCLNIFFNLFFVVQTAKFKFTHHSIINQNNVSLLIVPTSSAVKLQLNIPSFYFEEENLLENFYWKVGKARQTISLEVFLIVSATESHFVVIN